MLEKQLAWCLALHRNSMAEGCYDDVDDGRGRNEKEEGKEEIKKEEKRELAYPSLTFSHQNVKSV